MAGRSSRHTSVVHHTLIHDPLSSAAGSISIDVDPTRESVVSCLVPNSLAVACR
jgi:hypothetical protein